MNRVFDGAGRLLLVLPILLALVVAWPTAAKTPQNMFLAAESGELTKIQEALKAGVAVDVRDQQGQTSLLIATLNNRVNVARFLIARGADVNAKDRRGDTPFLYAGAQGRNEILKMMLRSGANLKDVNRYGGTSLTPAAHYGHVETVKILLQTEIDVDQINNLGWTALLEAIILGDGGKAHIEIVRMLLASKADPHIADGSGVTPLQHARQRGQSKIVELLLQAGAKR